MIVSHKYKFIFLKTKKTAGTSIEIALSQFCGPDDVITPIFYEDELVRKELNYRGPQNYIFNKSLCKISEILPKINLKKSLYMYYNHAPASYIKDHIGEDVWDSYFKFCFERNPYDKAISYYYWRTRNINEKTDISDILSNPERLSNWDIYAIDDKLAVDFVGKYENLHDDLSFIKEKLGLPDELNLPRTKHTYRKDKRHYSQLLDSHTRSLIERSCANELDAFSYKYENINKTKDV